MPLNLYSQESTEEGASSVPSYMIAANNHNIGNLNPSMFSNDDSEGGNLMSNPIKGLAAAAFSGVNSFYNTAVWAGNLFSDKDAQYRDTREWIETYDEDIGRYYDKNRQAADVLGFVATSFVPGLGGVKVFNAGAKALTAAKEGSAMFNMAKGFGVLPGQRAALVKEAVSSSDKTRMAFSFTNPTTLKAVAAGYGEQVLQAAAFETAVTVTMKKSPILNDMDVGDTLMNIASGAFLGGVIGGSIEAAGTVSKIKAGIKAMDTKLAGVTQDLRGVAGTSASDSLLIVRNDMDTLARNAPEGVDPTLYERLWEEKLARMDNSSRDHWTQIAGKNAELGNVLYEALRTDPTGQYAAKVLGLAEVGAIKKGGELARKYGIKDLIEEGVEQAENTHAIRYLKLWGDDMGKLSDEAPSALHLADMVSKPIEVRAGKVVAGDFSHEVKIGQYWNAAEAPYMDALARNIWAMDDTVPRLADRLNPAKGITQINIGAEDIPMLTKAWREGFKDFQLITKEGEVVARPGDLLSYIKKLKDDAAALDAEKAIMKQGEINAEQIANKYDVPLGYLTGEQYPTNPAEAIFGLAKAQKEWYQKFSANTINPPDVASVKPWLKGQHYNMVYDLSKVNGLDNFQVEAMTLIRARQKLQQATNDQAVAATLGNVALDLPDITDAEMLRVNSAGAGAGFVSFANANYGSAGSKAEFVGALVTKEIQRAQAGISDSFMTHNYQILNDSTKMAKLAAVMQKVRSAGSNIYVMNDTGTGLILRELRNYNRGLADGVEGLTPPIIPKGVDPEISIEGIESWVAQHIAVNGKRVEGINTLRAAKGMPASLDAEAFYPPAPNPARFKFHAFAIDDAKITSTGHTTMLYADSAENLEKQIMAAREQGFSVHTPGQTAEYYKARGMYDYSLGLNESQMDAALKRSGASAPNFPLTGTPQEMLQDIMEWHNKQEAILIREAVSTKYSRQFGTLQQMGKEYANVSNAKAGFFSKFKGEAQNPYEDYVKTFLGASLKNDYPLWTAVNNFIEDAGTKVYNTVTSLWRDSPSVRGMASPKVLKNGQYDWEKVNNVFDNYGLKVAATDAQMEAWVNHPAGRAAVSKFVQAQNSMIASLTLRLDPVNAINNAIGSTVLLGAETRYVTKGILAGNAEAVGELAELMKVVVPGTNDTITSSSKLIANAYKAFFSEGSEALMAKYKRLGVVKDVGEQFKELLEHATIRGTETAAELESKTAKMFALFNKIADFGEKWTGNKLAEEMNRFVSANVMDQITGVAVKRGLMSEQSANAYINTFVNRTQGNMIASQRPQLFQGPLGQAIGLFQTYQFNLMQQLLRYVGEGSKKDALTLLGLQGTIYGMNGLPAFQAINQHIIGTASGNRNHTDAYTSINNLAGKNAGDWITYGVASNLLIDPDLKINLYSRGDINPRQVTVVPSNFADIPLVSAWAKLTGTVKNSLAQVANGGDVWGTFLDGVEHQGLSRPLAGLARVARGFDGGISYSTSGNGNIVSANDLSSLANLARLSGAKPFDEAVTQDAVYRIQAYQAVDKQRRDALGRAVKSTILSGNTPSQEQLTEFAEKYAAAGGKQEEFTKWYVSQIRAATVPQANKIIERNNNQYSQYMQQIMGGRMVAAPTYVPAAEETEE